MLRRMKRSLVRLRARVSRSDQVPAPSSAHMEHLVAEGREDEALKVARELLSSGAKLPQWPGFGSACTNHLPGDESVELLAAWLRSIKPSDARVVRSALRVAREHGSPATVREVMEHAERQHPDDPRVQAQLGKLAFARGDLPRSIRAWQRAIEVATDASEEPRWYFHAGRSYEEAGQHARAADSYAAAIDTLLHNMGDDAEWAYVALQEWPFRLAYVRARSAEKHEAHQAASRSEDRRVRTKLEWVGPATATDGTFAALVESRGLRIRGTGPAGALVHIVLDDVAIRDVRCRDEDGSYTFLLRHSTLRRFPKVGTLRILQGARPLAAWHSAGNAVRITVDEGDGTILEGLRQGGTVTKKGHLSAAGRVGKASPVDLIDAYSRLRQIFAKVLGADLFLLYGSLLGIVRDQRLIAGDSDIDAGYLLSARGPDEAKAQAIESTKRLLEAGIDIGANYRGQLMSVTIDGIPIDVYPVWFQDGAAWAYNAFPAEVNHFLPVKEREVHGRTVALPSDAETLAERIYGEDWRTPDPNFRHHRSADEYQVLRRSFLTPAECVNLLRWRRRAAQGSSTPIGRFNRNMAFLESYLGALDGSAKPK
jgi:tetratricopeptide (TPR) repeat protein